MMKKDVFLRELEEIFLIDSGTIQESDTLKNLDVDSTAMLNLVAFLAGELEMEVDIDAIQRIVTVHDIVLLANDKLST